MSSPMSDEIQDRIVQCPRCKKTTAYSKSNMYRPFCSERCQMIDLGAWAEERHVISQEDSTDSSEQAPNPQVSDDDES